MSSLDAMFETSSVYSQYVNERAAHVKTDRVSRRCRPGGCEFDPPLRQNFSLAYSHLSPLQKHVRKVVEDFGMKSCVSTGVRKPANTYASPTAMI